MVLTPPAAAQVLVENALFVVPGWAETPLLFVGIQAESTACGRLKPTSSGSRSMARFGVPYTYKGRELPSTPFTLCPNLDLLRALIQDLLGCSFNAAVVNYYATGDHFLPPHSDTMAIPQLGCDPVIAGISWGVAREFLFTPLKKSLASIGVHQRPGDLLVMHGESQRRYRHSVPAVPGCLLPRWSVTFRYHEP